MKLKEKMAADYRTHMIPHESSTADIDYAAGLELGFLAGFEEAKALIRQKYDEQEFFGPFGYDTIEFLGNEEVLEKM